MNNRVSVTSAFFLVLATHVQGVSAQTALSVHQAPSGLAIAHALAFSPTQMYSLTADLFTRSYFAELRAVPNWGPEHPAWARHLSAFSADMQTLLLPPGVTLEAHLSSELQRKLNGEELSELNASISKPDFTAATARLSHIGASWGNLVLIQMVMREPKFYSAAERAQAKAVVAALRGQVSGEQADTLRNELKPIVALLESPAFLKYQSALGSTFMADAKRMGETPETRRGFELLMQRWHTRLKSGT